MPAIKTISLLSVVIVSLVFCKSISAQTTIDTFPKPKHSLLKSRYIVIPKDSRFHVDKVFYTKYKATFDSINDTFNDYGTKEKTAIDIIISRITDFSTINQAYQSDLKKPEAYLIDISKNMITISASKEQGLLNGLSTLEALVQDNRGVIQEGIILDYPDLKMRVLHLSMWPSTVTDFKESIRLARLEHFNALIWLNHFGVKLKSLEHLKVKNKNRWTIEQFKEMIIYAKQNGMEIIPGLKLLSHQEKFMANYYPQYMYNKLTYDPRVKELYEKVVFPAIDELLLLTGAIKFHIGHDEVVGWKERHYIKNLLQQNEKQLPPELFIQDILVLHNYLRERGVETWMWSDMLYTKGEFPSMNKAGANLNGTNGFSVLRTKIPSDVVMCAWHYRGSQQDFPTAESLTNDGHNVLGATWKFQKTAMNYAKYIYKHSKRSSNAVGMIATTWYGLSGKRKSKVKDIIKFSGEAFWNAK